MSFEKWLPIHRLPLVLRRTLAATCELGRFWTADTPQELFLKVFRRSVQMPVAFAVGAQNPLEGIAYRMPERVGRELKDRLIGSCARAVGRAP